jgi:hypothetical protein
MQISSNVVVQSLEALLRIVGSNVDQGTEYFDFHGST